MGLQFRTRTKGKNGWLNISHSKKNGFSASLSVKVAKGVTMNFGGKGNRRAIVNFGNGVRYVKYRSPKAKEPRERKTRSTRSSNTYTPVRYTREECLVEAQTNLINLCKRGYFRNSADAQIIVDFYNAINLIKEGPISLEDRDLMLVTLNQYREIVERENNPDINRSADVTNTYIRSILPDRPKPPPPPIKEEKHYGWWIAGVVTLLILIKSCT